MWNSVEHSQPVPQKGEKTKMLYFVFLCTFFVGFKFKRFEDTQKYSEQIMYLSNSTEIETAMLSILKWPLSSCKSRSGNKHKSA